MANEIRVTCGLQIRKGSVDYQSRPSAFVATLAATIANGPTPGSILVPRQGIKCDLSLLSNPGMCRIANLEDATATPYRVIEYGIADPQTGRFYPLGEVWPGESYVIRLGRHLRGEYGTAVGTAPVTDTSNQFWFRSIDPSGASAHAKVEAFET